MATRALSIAHYLLARIELSLIVHGPELATVHPPLLLGQYMGFSHFSKWPPWKSNLDNISSSNWHRIIIFVPTPIFSGSKNRMKPLLKILGHSYVAISEKSKMAAGKIILWRNHNIYILKNKFDLLTLYKNTKYIVIRLRMVIKDSFISLIFEYYAVIVQKYVLNS